MNEPEGLDLEREQAAAYLCISGFKWFSTFFFLFFGVVTSTGSVYQVGVVGGLDNTARAIKKQIGLARVSAWFFIALATAFRAANSSLILAFTTKK